MTDTILELQGLSKSFKDKPVLQRIDLSISRGRVVGLLGKNGAGKTTLLKCALGLLKTTSGTSRIFGEDSWDLSGDAKARIGYVPQKIDLHSWMKVRQMIAYYAAFYSRWNDALTSTLLSNWELPQEDRVGTLSEGQVQKLGLILAMGHEPDLLVLDEPAASLDPQARRTFLGAVIDIANNHNRTVILSTHLTSDLERVASDIVMLKSGVINYSGSMDDLKESVKSLTLTSERQLPARLDLPGLLNFGVRDNHAILTMRGVTPDTPKRNPASIWKRHVCFDLRDLVFHFSGTLRRAMDAFAVDHWCCAFPVAIYRKSCGFIAAFRNPNAGADEALECAG